MLLKALLRLMPFSSGRLPESDRGQLEKERIEIEEENVLASITYRNYRGRGRAAKWKRTWCLAAFVLTSKRLFACANGRRMVNLPFDEDKTAKAQCTLEDGDRLCIRIQAEDFHPDQRGTIEIRLRTRHADLLYHRMRKVAQAG